MDRLKCVEIFKAVAERRSFVRAAEALDLSTAVVSRAVNELEALLGVRLLQRSTRRVSVTAEGQRVLESGAALLHAFDELLETGRSGVSNAAGEIRFAAPALLAARLGPTLADYMAHHPRVRVDLVLTDMPLDLVEHGVDLALRVAWDLPDSVIARRIGDARVGVFGAPAYLKRTGVPRHPDELSRHDCLVCCDAGRKWHFSHPVTGHRVEPSIRPKLHANQAGALVTAAVHGSGLALLPDFVVSEAVERGELQAVLPQWGAPALGVYLLYGARNPPLRVRKLIDHLADEFDLGRPPSTVPPGAAPGVRGRNEAFAAAAP